MSAPKAPKTLEYCEIIKNDEISPEIYDLTVTAPKIVAAAAPGQFCGIYPKAEGLLLPRPISICEADPSNNVLRFVYRIEGKGTDWLSRQKKGETLKIMGALGNGFLDKPELANIKSAALVGGGIGVPPLLMLAQALRSRYSISVTAVLAARDEPVLVNDFEKCGARVHLATDTGRIGFKGNAVGLIKSLETNFDIVFSCGPAVMMKYLSEWAKSKEIPCYVSLEERMGCGFGVCVGCVCKIKNTEGNGDYKKVCVDGPVFNADSVVWQ